VLTGALWSLAQSRGQGAPEVIRSIHFGVEKVFQSFLFFCKKVGIITFRRIGNSRFVLQEYFG